MIKTLEGLKSSEWIKAVHCFVPQSCLCETPKFKSFVYDDDDDDDMMCAVMICLYTRQSL